jgi:tetratricopeptide (TPR) repeat protein
MEVSARVFRWGPPLLIVFVVLASFFPLFGNDFVNWDDPFYFTINPHFRGLSLVHLRWMFTTLYMGHYQPLTWLTHAVVYSGWGVTPVGCHAGNLLLHAANAVVLSMLILALLRQPVPAGAQRNDIEAYLAATAGALFFAIHPLRVEAVAWATERQEVLSAFFLLLALLAYVRMQARKAVHGSWHRWYAFSVACFAMSLMSKAAGITLPLVLIVLDIYPLRRSTFSGGTATAIQLIREKIPYFVAAGGAGVVVLLAKQPEAMATLSEHGLLARVMQVFYGLWFGLWKTVVPVGLSPLYLLEKPLHPTAPRFVLSALLVAGLAIGVTLLRHRWPAVLAAWTCYVLLMLPVSGIVQSGPQITADRYTYLACLPWAVLLAAGVRCAWRSSTSPRARWQVTAATAAVLLFLSVRTNRQTRVWHDSLTLWNHVLSIEPNNYVGYNNRGEVRYAAGDVDGALLDFNRAIVLNPNYDNAYGNRGTARLAKRDASGALADYDRALRINPRYASAYYNRGNIRRTRGDLDGALADYQRALALSPEYAVAYNARGRTYQAKGDLEAARADYSRAIRLDPAYANAYNNRSTVRSARGDLAGAIADCTAAVRLSPANGPHRAMFERNLARLRSQLAERSQNR